MFSFFTIPVNQVSAENLFDNHFDSDAEGFSYADDAFRGTNQPGYASGSWGSSYGFSGGGLRVYIGAINGDDINGMSGGWSESFNLAEPATVTISFHYQLTIASEYESDEYGQALFSLDGVLHGDGPSSSLAQINGNGNGGSADSTGWLQYQEQFSLSADSHTITIGGYNNKKTYADEWVEVLIDDVLVTTDPPPPPPPSILSADFDIDTDDFSLLTDSFRNTNNLAYTSGDHLPNGGYSGGGLQLYLGGIDDADIFGISAGWSSPFFLSESTDVTLSFRYNMTQSADYDTNDHSQMLVSVDGVLYGSSSNSYVSQLTGDGNGGSNQTTGWQLFQVDLGPIPAGSHSLIIGGYNDQKSSASERTEILIDDVLVDGDTVSQSQVVYDGYDVTGYHGVVSSGTSTATNVGIDILAQGGNAFDAAVATNLALTESDNTLVHFGGEVPIILYDNTSDQIKVISGQGPAPELGTLSYFQSIGGIPSSSGNIKNAAVPGLLLGLLTMLHDYGTMTFEQVATPTQQLYAAHTGWKADMADTLQQMINADITTRNAGGTREDGIAAAKDLFYSGSIADEMDNWLRNNGGLIRKSDLESYAENWAPIEDPVSIDYNGYTIYKTLPWTQGPYALETLQILEDMNLRSMGHNQPDYIHAVIEALKLGFADRDEYFGDPDFVYVPTDNIISEEYADLRRGLIDMQSASHQIRPGDPFNMQATQSQTAQVDYGPQTDIHDTSTVVTADRWGNVVVATPSGWGGTLVGNTGVYYGNRLRSNNTWSGHPNAVAPGKRPRITLTPTLVFKDGVPMLAISVAGGDQQDQAVVQIITNVIEFGFDAGESVETPRAGTGHYTGSFSQPSPDLGSLTLDSSTPSSIRDDLANRGHDISTSSSSYGRPSVILIHPNGAFEAAGDSSANRYAAAFTDLTSVANNPPTADPQSVFTDEDALVAITISGSDPDSDPITFHVVTNPIHGSLSGAEPNLTYTPDPDFNGSDSFQFMVNDGYSDSASATVSITVNPVNDAPVANSQAVSTNEDIPVAITLTGSDVDGDSLTITVISTPSNGSLSGTVPNLTYTPNVGYNGADSFKFTVNDGTVTSAEATVSITVNAVNDAPSADAQSVETDEDTAVLITLYGFPILRGDASVPTAW